MIASLSHRGGWGLLALVGLLAVAVTAQPVHGQGKTSESVVVIKAKAEKPDDSGKQVVSVTVSPAKGWYVYANPVGNADFEDNQTVVKVTGKEAKVEYPAGKLTKDKTVGDYSVYEEPVTIKATIQRGKDDKGKLEVSVKIQACSKAGRCLLPSTVKVPVE
jgi:thiol:disulfide interchange protein